MVNKRSQLNQNEEANKLVYMMQSEPVIETKLYFYICACL